MDEDYESYSEDEYGGSPALGGLGGLGGLSLYPGQLYSSEESKQYARDILEADDPSIQIEDELIDRLRQSAESTRAALRAARKQITGKEFDKTQSWLRAAAAAGQPTQSGAFGETMGNVSNALANERSRKELEEQADLDRLLNLDLSLGKVDEAQLGSELAIAGARRKSRNDLNKEALRVLSRLSNGQGAGKVSAETREAWRRDPRPGAAAKRDETYAADYIEWRQTGQLDAEKSLKELQSSLDTLQGKGIDPKTGKPIDPKSLTGGVAGTIYSLGDAGKYAQDLFNPNSSAVQEATEQTVQRALRAVLGAQFTQKEGDRLIARGFNIRLGPEENAKRVGWLLQSLTEMYQAKQAMAAYFEKNGTLEGFTGKTDFDIADIERSVDSFIRAREEQERAAREGNARGGRIQYADGGLVEDEEDPLASLYASLGMASGAGLGAGVAYNYGADRLRELDTNQRMREAVQGDVAELGAEVKRAQRLGVPMSMMESGDPGLRTLTSKALGVSEVEAPRVLSDLDERYQGSRARVRRQAEKHLKADGYFEEEAKLTQKMRENAAPMYRDLYAKYPGIRERDIPAFAEIMAAPDGKKAVKIALRIMQNEGKPIGKENAMGLVQRPSLEFLDYVKRGLDELIIREENKSMKSTGPLVKSMRDLRRRFRDQLDQATDGEYKAARDQYAGDLEVRDALRLGREGFNRLQPEELQEMIEEMTPNERIALRTGVAQFFRQKINAPMNEPNAARYIIGPPDTRVKIDLLFDKKSEAKLFQRALEFEARLYDEAKRLSRVGHSAEERRIGSAIDRQGSLVDDISRAGSRLPVVRMVLNMINGKSLTPEAGDEILRALNTGNPAEVDALMQRLSKEGLPSKVRPRIGKAGKIGAAAGAAGVITDRVLSKKPLLPEDEE